MQLLLSSMQSAVKLRRSDPVWIGWATRWREASSSHSVSLFTPAVARPSPLPGKKRTVLRAALAAAAVLSTFPEATSQSACSAENTACDP